MSKKERLDDGGSVNSTPTKRTSEEIQARIAELKKEISRNDVWIDTGIISKTMEPSSLRNQDILNGKLLELRWLLGDDVQVSDGL
jgi:hypothetical protein